MTDVRILPDLQCSLMCEDVRQEANGNIFLIGVLNQIVVPQVPVAANKLACFNRWTAGVGEFNEVVKLLAPDQSTVVRENALGFTMENPGVVRTNVHMFQGVEFTEAGVYYVEVTIDDVLKLRYPLPLVVMPQNQNGDANAGEQN
ncbi:MAG: hypothetical protein VCB81_01805 [Verrucomicrobiia bacterium]|jgi:hypothetical protein